MIFMNIRIITENELLDCIYITSDKIAFAFFTCVSARMLRCSSVVAVGVGVGDF